MQDYRAPWWLPGGHLQTVWSALYARRYAAGRPGALAWRRERWETPDADFVDVDYALPAAPEGARVLVLFHGLEGSSRSHYAEAMARACQARGWQLVVPHFRGCSGTPNRLLRAYHSGDVQELDWILRRFHARHGRVLAMGVSLGGNALARWAGVQGERSRQCVRAAAVVSAPLNMAAAAAQLQGGLNHWIYGRSFLRSMLPKVMDKARQFPQSIDGQRIQAIRNLQEFDAVFTAPVHGFASAEDYWSRASAAPVLASVAVPLLLLNARNDPLIPIDSLPVPAQLNSWVECWRPAQGGHAGFVTGAWPGQVHAMPEAVCNWLGACLQKPAPSSVPATMR